MGETLMFSFGGTKSSSQSSSYGYDRSVSDSFSQGASRSSQGIAFEDIFANLYGGASSVAGRLATQAPGLSDQASMLFSGGLGFLDTLQGGADTAYLESRLGGNPLLDEQIDALGGDIGQFFREEINPAITSQHVAGGTLGGGRQGVAQGKAAEAAGREFQRGATELRARDIAARDAAAAQLQAGRIGGATAGLSAIPGLFGVAQGGFGAELAPYQALAGILGGPTVLTQASSDEIARAMSAAFGEEFSQSSTKSKSASFGFGSK